jgi:PAS domain S-box-containing protein
VPYLVEVHTSYIQATQEENKKFMSMLSKTSFVLWKQPSLQIRNISNKVASNLLSWYPHEDQDLVPLDTNHFQVRDTMLLLIPKPETALGAVSSTEFSVDGLQDLSKVDQTQSQKSWEQQLFLSLTLGTAPESAIGARHVAELIDDQLECQLKDRQQESLPKTLSEALNDSRPIVVTSTESPFQIVEVNDAWVGLCGYTKEEAKGQDLGTLLQGPETQAEIADQMINRLREESHSRATLVNYTKQGRKFQNYVQLGRLMAEDAQYFVGVLQEIDGIQTNQHVMKG